MSTQDFSQLRKLITIKKTEMSTLHIVTKYLAEAPLESQVFIFYATSFAHQHLAIICYSSVMLDVARCTCSGFLQKYLIGFKLRLWLDHSRTSTELSIRLSCCMLWVIVLLKVKPSAQSEALNALDWVFIKAF